jgi:hypothetical protein
MIRQPSRSTHCLFDQHQLCADGAKIACSCGCHVHATVTAGPSHPGPRPTAPRGAAHLRGDVSCT